MKTKQHFLVFLKRHALKVTNVVVSFDLLVFFYNLKRTNEKNEAYHIATKTTRTFTTFTVITLTFLVFHC